MSYSHDNNTGPKRDYDGKNCYPRALATPKSLIELIVFRCNTRGKNARNFNNIHCCFLSVFFGVKVVKLGLLYKVYNNIVWLAKHLY